VRDCGGCVIGDYEMTADEGKLIKVRIGFNVNYKEIVMKKKDERTGAITRRSTEGIVDYRFILDCICKNIEMNPKLY
jgi:hypothetical protein